MEKDLKVKRKNKKNSRSDDILKEILEEEK